MIEIDILREKLRDHMQAHNLTQTAVGKKTGVPQSTISRFMGGESDNIRARHYIALSKMLGTTTMTAPALLKQEQAHAAKLKEVRAELARAERDVEDLVEAVEWVCEVGDYYNHRLSDGRPPSRAWGELERSVTQARLDLDGATQKVRREA